jgi:hypothetical protein
MSSTQFATDTSTLQLPVYQSHFSQGLALAKSDGNKTYKIWGNEIFTLAPDGSKISYKPSMTSEGIKFAKVNVPLAPKET